MELLNKYEVFSDVLSIEEQEIFVKHLQNTISMEASGSNYISHVASYLESCQDTERVWSDTINLQNYLQSLYDESIFVPTVLWSIQSCVGSLFVSLKNVEVLEENKTLGMYLKRWNDSYVPTQAKTFDEKDIKKYLLDHSVENWRNVWEKPCYCIQLSALGRKIEVAYMYFDDIGSILFNNNYFYILTFSTYSSCNS